MAYICASTQNPNALLDTCCRFTEIGEDFASLVSVRNARIDVTDELIERCATTLSTNDMVVGRARSAKSNPSTVGTVRRLAIDKNM